MRDERRRGSAWLGEPIAIVQVAIDNQVQGHVKQAVEPDLTRTIEVRGEQVHPHKFSLCWAGYELYNPKSAEDLAKLRVSRERGKAERQRFPLSS
jgi:hypothetical protein